MSLPKYPKYKDSGVEWLGEVPEHWEVMRLRHAVNLNPSKSETASLDPDTIISFLPMEAVGEDGTLSLNQTRPISTVKNGYTYFRNGDVTIAKITPCFENGKGALMRGLKEGVGFGTTELIVARPHQDRITSEFLAFLFRSAEFRLLGEGEMYGAGGQKRVPDSFVREFDTALPPLEEQTTIASFLDRETGKIDALVDEQRRLIELLKEKRQAVISHAVTKGLDPDVAMKDSGVEWLGEVPEHWEVKKMKRVAEMQSGHTPDKKIPEYWKDCTIPWISLNDTKYLKDHEYISDTAYRVNDLGIANSSAKLLPERVVVFSRDATIGRCAIATRPMAVSQHFIAWVCSEEILPEYLLMRLRSMTHELERLTAGATLKTIGMPDVKTLTTPVPPIQEQSEIVEHLKSAKDKLDNLIYEAEHAVTLLQERRTALISAAVTGKIDVRTVLETQTEPGAA
jgi:type I restriction enzyme, S subunit